MGRQAIVWRLVRRDVRSHPLRSLLVVLLIATPVAGGTFVEITDRTNSSRALQNYRDVGPADAGLAVDSTPLTAPRDLDPALLPAGTRIVRAPLRDRVGFLSATKVRVAAEVLIADITEPLTANRARLLSGRAPAGPEDIAVNRPLALELGLLDKDRLRTDARVTLAGGDTLTVTGLALNAACLSCPLAVAPFDSFLSTRNPPDTPKWADESLYLTSQDHYDYLLDLPDGTDLAALGAAVKAVEHGGSPDFELEPFKTYRVEDHAMYDGSPPRTSERVRSFAFASLLGGLGALEVALLAGTAFVVGTRRQARDLRLFAAQGAGPRTVRRVLLAQAAVLGAIGAAVGVGAGLFALRQAHGWWERRADAVVDGWHGRPYEIAAIAALGVAVALFAALAPALQLSRRQVVGTVGRCRPWRSAAGAVLLASGAALGLAGSRSLTDEAFRNPIPRDGGYWAPNLLTYQPAQTSVLTVLAGFAAAVVGIVLLAPGVVALVRRCPGPLSVRLAAHETGRRRSLTGPITAAIAMAVAGAVAMTVLAATNDAVEFRAAGPPSETDAVVFLGHNGFPIAADWNRYATDLALAHLPAARVVPVTAPDLPNPSDYLGDTLDGGAQAPLPERSDWCPDGARSCLLGATKLGIASPDILRLTAGGAFDEAIATKALDEGKAVVFGPGLRDENGRVHVLLPAGGGPLRFAALDAVVLPWPVGYEGLPTAFVSEATARTRGWGVRLQASMVTHDPAPASEIRAVLAETDGVHGYALGATAGRPAPGPGTWAGAAALLAAAGVAIPLALRAGERSPYLRVLAAVGVTPRRLRRIAAAQALLPAGLGTALGLALGLGFARAARPAVGSDVTVVPWTELGAGVALVCLLAVAVGLGGTLRRPTPARRAD